MKELKNVGKFGFNQKVNLNNRGMSLIELMTAVGASMFVIAGAVIVMQMGMREFYLLNEQNKALESLERAALFLRVYTQNAVNVRATTGPIPAVANTPDANGIVDSSRGYMGGMVLPNGNAGFDSTLLAANYNTGYAHKLGIFYIENGNTPEGGVATDPNTDGSFLRALGLWYQVPNVGFSGSLASGIIYMDFDARGAAQPDANDLWFPYFTAFRMEVIPAPASPPNPNGPVWQVVYNITVRYYLGGDKSNWFYDPLIPAPATPIGVGYKEETREIRVGLRNNALSNSQIAANGVVERAQGPLYYFRLQMPLRGQFIRGTPP